MKADGGRPLQHSAPSVPRRPGAGPTLADAVPVNTEDPLLSPEHARPAAWRVLERAARRVAAPVAGPPADSRNGVARESLPLLEAVRAIAGANAPRLASAESRLRACDIDSLRAEFLEQVRREPALPDGRQFLDVLRALEQLRVAVEERSANGVADRLGGQVDGLTMVVEVVHDMRSPLSSILFLVDYLRRKNSGPLNSAQERQLNLIYSAAFGLGCLVSDVVEMARGGDRLVDGRAFPFSIAEVIHEVRDIVVPVAEEKGLVLETSATGRDPRVGYAAAIGRVLLNLTTNALKYTEQGRVSITAEPRSETRVELAVADTGPGIPEHVLAQLYQPFRPSCSPGGSRFSNAGLGLAICRRLVELMGGELRVETGPGRGTRFSFELDLPLASKSAD
jgi:signal transduction histidine kinase